MSVEKIDFNVVKQESKTFTTHLNSVLQNLRNPEALGIWAYLSSHKENWIVNKQHLMNHFNIGRDKLNTALRYLQENDLLEMGQERGEDGKLGRSYILVKCGYNFTRDCKAKTNKQANTSPHTENPPPVSPYTEKPSTVSPYTANPHLINKNKEINKIKRKESASRAPLSLFEPDDKNKALCKRLGLILAEEMASFEARCRHDKNQYEFERWLKASKEHNEKKNVSKINEIRCTVPDYGPGHPTWEFRHGKNGIMNKTKLAG